MKHLKQLTNLWLAVASLFTLVSLLVSCGDVNPARYALVLPDAPVAWVSLLGEPHWRLEWLDTGGEKRAADVPPGETAQIEPPMTWANPVTAWPYWPEHNLIPGLFKPAGALFPFDARGERLPLSWSAGVDTVFYWELALAANDNDASAGVKIPANFDWPRFRELFEDETLNEAVRKDPWLVDWRSVAESTMNSSFDRRRLVPQTAESVTIPVPQGPWYGTSPFAEPLQFPEDKTPVFPVQAGLNVWVSTEGILKCNGAIWLFVGNGE